MAKPLHPHNKLNKTEGIGEEVLGVGVAEVEAEERGGRREAGGRGSIPSPPTEEEN